MSDLGAPCARSDDFGTADGTFGAGEPQMAIGLTRRRSSAASRRSVAVGTIAALVLGAALASPARAYPRPGTTERVSVASDGTQGESVSFDPALSADGRHVAFGSLASNLVPGDTNGRTDVFVHDRESGSTERVSLASDGTEGNGISQRPTISADGRYVAFVSLASNLVPGDTNGPGAEGADVFVHDRDTGITERVSVASDGTEGETASDAPAISADGRYVAFLSFASNLVPGDTNDQPDAFVHDVVTGTTERVSGVTPDGAEASYPLSQDPDDPTPSISADGRYVAFQSMALDLVPGDTNGTIDIFVHDRDTATSRVSVASDGTEGNGMSWGPTISADGRHVAFASFASNLVPGDTKTSEDVFVHDRQTGTTERVSVNSAGTEGNRVSTIPAISADGRHVAFQSFATNLVPETNARRCAPVPPPPFVPCADVYVHDRETGTTERVSVTSDHGEGNDWAHVAAISADGRHVAFESTATNLVPGDTNGGKDVFVRDRGPTTGIGALAAQRAGDDLMVSGRATFSGAVVAAADDPEADGQDMLGAEIGDASIIHRPEEEDLLLDLGLKSLPHVTLNFCRGLAPLDFGEVCAHSGAGAPAVVYRWSFTLGVTAYEVRAIRAAATAAPPTVGPYFGLYECTPICTETAKLAGGIGTTGPEVRVAVPLEALGAEGGAELTDVEASTALGEATPGALEILDDVDLPDAVLPISKVELGIAPPAAPPAQVPFSAEADLVEGEFSATLSLSSLPGGEHRLWARACLAETCGATSVPVTLGDGPSPTPTPTGSPTPTPTGEPTPTPTPTPTESPAPEPTGVRGVYPEAPNDPYFALGGAGESTAEAFAEQWGPKKIQAPQAWQVPHATGHRVNVAVIDSGLDLGHPDFACPGKVGNGAVIINGEVTRGASAQDIDGHGTHVAGIIGACTNNGTGTVGVAPDSKITPYRVFTTEDEEAGVVEDIAVAIEQATDDGAHVINMSLGIGIGGLPITGAAGYLPGLVPEIDDAIEDAQEAGVVVVAAAGNSTALPLCEYPAIYEDVLCVGATDPRDVRTWYSTFPNKPDNEDDFGPAVVAPGGTEVPVFCDLYFENVLSTYARDLDDNSCDGLQLGYDTINGTSMASPHVAGVAALLYDRLGAARSAAAAELVIETIVSSTVDLGAPGYDPVYGFGRVDALAAVTALEDPDPDPSTSPSPTPSGSPSPTPSGSPSPTPSGSPSVTPSSSPSPAPSPSPSSDPGPAAPAAPTNLTAKAAAPTRVELSWTDNSSTETGFALERSPDGSSWQEIASTGAGQTAYLDSGLAPDTTYSYRVRAFNAAGHSPYSNTAAATTPARPGGGGGQAQQAPAAPSQLNADAASSDRIQLTWADNAANENGFAIERSQDGSWQEIATVGRDQTTYLDSGLAPDTTYSYRVRAYNSAGHSFYSNVASATTKRAPAQDPSPSPTESPGPVEGEVTSGSATTTITSARAVIKFNRGFELSGAVDTDGGCSDSLEIDISRRIHGTDTYRHIATTPVTGDGTWGLRLGARRNASYIAQVRDTDNCRGETSTPTDVLVRVKVKVKAKSKAPRSCDGREVVRGKVRPNHADTKVILQKRTRKGWRKVDSDILNKKSRFRLRARRCGLHRVAWRTQADINVWGATKLRI